MKVPPYIYVMIFAIGAGLYGILKKKLQGLYLQLFIIFLAISLFVELLASFLLQIKKQENTLLLFNIFTAFEFMFYLWVIREVIRNRKAKKVMLFILLIYPLTALINVFFFQGKHGFHSFTYALGCLLIVISCIYYFYELFLIPYSVNLLRQPSFWICTALLFFYAFTYPIYGLSNLMMSLPKTILINLERIVYLLNVLLYSMFSIAFLCRIKIRKYSRS
ncbi:hypothetical protein GALL_94670 [mine drainage metagenome]|uniref:Uncharacterized protein n=1 Tax=mine drainage metagenome TaxID=410659 RepID=A0A1J5SK37_9ZZZZ